MLLNTYLISTEHYTLIQQMKMSYILLLLFSFSFSNSQYIATSHSHDIVLAYTLQYLQRALNQNLLEKLKEIEISDFTAGTYKVTSVKPVSVLADFKGSLGICIIIFLLYLLIN